MNSERRKAILSLIKEEGEVRLNKLRELFPDVSEMTLRRDLDSLEKDKLVQRTHGGAKLINDMGWKDEPVLASGFTTDMNDSFHIVKNALHFLEEERSIYLDGGNTMLSFAQSLPDIKLYTITNAPDIALSVMKKNNAEVIILGGALNKNTVSLAGPFALSIIDKLNIDIAFISATGLSLESGFTTPYFNECELKQKVIKMAKKVIVLLEHAKVNRSLPFTFAALEDVDVIITDRELPEELYRKAVDTGVEVVF